MKLLVVGHHIVVGEYQELWTVIASQHPELAIEILCPTVYRQQGLIQAEAFNPRLVPVRTLPAAFARSGRQHLHFYWGLDPVLDHIRPDYVYCAEESNSLVTAQVVRACTQRGIPVVFWTSLNQIRIYNRMHGRLNPRRYLFHYCQRYVFDHCAGANATSNEAVEVLRAQGFRKKITCRPTHGVGSVFLDVGRRRIESPPSLTDRLRIGFVGTFHDYKGIDVLLKAFARMEHRPRAQIALRGEGPEEIRLRQLAAQLGIADDVTWHSRAPYHDMSRVFSNLDVLVLPSLERSGVLEKFGRVLIEAMASGAVAVGSRAGGIPLALAGGGRLFDPGNAEQLASILDQLCVDSTELKRWQALGFKTVHDTYSYDVVGRNLVEGLRNDIGFLGPSFSADRFAV